jgi:hypothetical protein
LIDFRGKKWDNFGKEFMSRNSSLSHWECDKYFVGTAYDQIFFMVLFKYKPNDLVETSVKTSVIADWDAVRLCGFDYKQKIKLRDIAIYAAGNYFFETLGHNHGYGFIKKTDKKVIKLIDRINEAPMEESGLSSPSGVPLMRWDFYKEDFRRGVLLDRAKKAIYNL